MSLFKSPKTALILALAGFSLIGLSLVSSKVLPLINRPDPILEDRESQQNSQNLIKVDVSGEVLKPSVYELAEGSRIEDAIAASGGLTERADKDWIGKNLNLAQKLADGAKIYLPTVGKYEKTSSNVLGVINNIEGKINVNTASEAELDTLSGVGPVTAQKIISGRPYQTIEDLKTKKVVSGSVFEKIKDKITVY